MKNETHLNMDNTMTKETKEMIILTIITITTIPMALFAGMMVIFPFWLG